MKRILLTFIIFIFSSVIQAEGLLAGTKEIVLVSANNQPMVIGSILFTQQSEKIQYKIEFEEELFHNEFLSMRPFQCIHQDKKMLCHLVYPYDKQGYITESDLTDLEYDLLFLHKGAKDYGIDAWNGLYYKLEIDAGNIKGALHEVDLNVLVAPPEEGDLRPITQDMLYPAEPEQHLYPSIEIR